jgi:hypothetical protein
MSSLSSPVFQEYKDTMTRIIQMYYPISKEELSPVLDYSIRKRYKSEMASVDNSYTNKSYNMNLLKLIEYIDSKQPIVTAFGTMFKKHADVPNPLAIVVQQFLDQRSIHKKQMFKYPKGSEEFEHYNLLQSLDKIDCNGIYGTLGMYTSLLFDINVASSITSAGKSFTASMTLLFESFLSNNVKFGSLNEILQFIDNVKSERPNRKFLDNIVLDDYITAEDCFGKLVLSCGYRWVPDEEEMEIIWRVVNNLSQYDLNRVYYKNNLYNFCENSYISNMIVDIIATLDAPYINPLKCPEIIRDKMDVLTDLLREYVYYGYVYIDRIDRCENMIKNICMISDTDSTIISLDAWFRFVHKLCIGHDIKIARVAPVNPIYELEKDEFGDYTDKAKELMSPIYKIDPEYDYDFENDTLTDLKHITNPLLQYPEDNMRYTIINVMAYVLDKLVNEYMEKCATNNHSYTGPERPCKIIAKNEFLFKRVLLTQVKKSYASIMELQEGNIVPKDSQLDVKGIAAIAKSSIAKSTRDKFKKILLEDILNTPVIDQFKIIKDIAIMEKNIMMSINSGSKEYYKPVTVKAQSVYADPMRQQGIKASYVWNSLKPANDGLPLINLDERNAVDIAKIDLREKNLDSIKDKYPEVYENAKRLFETDTAKIFKGSIDSIAIPLDVNTPDWVLDIIDYKTIINNNLGGFPYESVGIQRLNKTKVNYTNILQL